MGSARRGCVQVSGSCRSRTTCSCNHTFTATAMSHPVESSQHRRTRPPLCLARALIDWRVTRRQQTAAGRCRRVHFSRMLTLVARTVAPCGFRLGCGGWGGCGWAGTGSSVCARRCAHPCARVSERLHRTCPLCAGRVLERKRKGEGGGRGERPGGLRTV